MTPTPETPAGIPPFPRHETCAEILFDIANAPTNPMQGLAGGMAVSNVQPPVTAQEFPPQRMRCTHGEWFYTYPTHERIAALRALNGDDQ